MKTRRLRLDGGALLRYDEEQDGKRWYFYIRTITVPPAQRRRATKKPLEEGHAYELLNQLFRRARIMQATVYPGIFTPSGERAHLPRIIRTMAKKYRVTVIFETGRVRAFRERRGENTLAG